jgi:hypothetical protein
MSSSTEQMSRKDRLMTDRESADEEQEQSPDDSDGSEPGSEGAKATWQLSVSIRSLVVGVVIVLLAGAVGIMTWLYIGAQNELDAQARQTENYARAEKTALDYAVNAAAMDSQDLNAWKSRLVDGTSPELKEKLTKAAESMEQILVPLKWDSTARPLAAKVRSHDGAMYVVDAFVSVLTKTMQAPEGLQSTATYSVTIDGGSDWKITDVGGIGTPIEQK